MRTEDVRNCAAEQGVSEEEALKRGMEKSRKSSWKKARMFTLRPNATRLMSK